jgi:DNA-binding NarL/FixJ family response regulator
MVRMADASLSGSVYIGGDQSTQSRRGVILMRILLADDQPKVRFGLRTLLERKLGFEVVGEATDVKELWQQVEEKRPDLLLLDWELPGRMVKDLLLSLHANCPYLRVIALSGRTELRRDALQAGVDAFVCKCDSPDQLLKAIGQLVLDEAQIVNRHEIDPYGAAAES